MLTVPKNFAKPTYQAKYNNLLKLDREKEKQKRVYSASLRHCACMFDAFSVQKKGTIKSGKLNWNFLCRGWYLVGGWLPDTRVLL